MFTGRIKKITSLENPEVKHLAKLREKSYRELAGTTLIISEIVIRELIGSCKIKTLIIREEEIDKIQTIPAETCYIVTDQILKKISGLPSPPSWLAEIPIANPSSLKEKSLIVALDRISDPGNLGTLCRTALALGWEGLFLTPGCTDLFSDKTVRASRGASFLLPYARGSYEELFLLAEKREACLCIADIKGEDVATFKPKKPLILLLGNEAHGVSEEVKTRGHLLRIPISPQIESLNVAVAAAIFMYHLKTRIDHEIS